MIYEKIEKEYERIKKEIEETQKQIEELPQGKLQCVQDGKRLRWYRCIDGTRKYLSKKKGELTEKLALKKYLLSLLSGLNQEKTAIEFYLKHHKTNQEMELLNPTSPYYPLLKSYFLPNDESNQKWMKEEFSQNENYKEQLIYKSSSGNIVRSKSELMIDMLLYMNKIPFRYECALQLGELTIYPDFTILHPVTKELYYWEHFGKMDDSNYCKNACIKLQTYCANGIIPTVNLLTTFETKEYPLDTDRIEKIIKEYFL